VRARSYVVYATDLTACVTHARPVQIRILEGLNSRVLNQLVPEDTRPAPRLYKGEQSLVEEGASTRHARRRGSAPRENNHAESRPYTRAREELITALLRATHTQSPRFNCTSSEDAFTLPSTRSYVDHRAGHLH
jgi:hypothetical protein